MRKHNKLFIFLKVLINILYVVGFLFIAMYFGIKLGANWIDQDFSHFFIKYGTSIFLLVIIYYVPFIISVIWHEFGHLLFGVHAKLDFISFSIFKLSIIKKNGKLAIDSGLMIPGTAGNCNMSFDENKQYKKNSIVLFFLGGILFNIIFVICFSIILFLINNIYLHIICLSFILTNAYLAIYNSIPFVLKTGLGNDMMQIINYLNDPQFTKIYSRIDKIQNSIQKGISLKDIDKNLFYMPKSFYNNSDFLMALFYIEYLCDKEDYDNAIICINDVKIKAKNIISEYDMYNLNVLFILSVFYNNLPLEQISNIWDSKLEKFLAQMELFNPEYLGVEYLYTKLIKKDNQKSEKYKQKFETMISRFPNKMEITETKKIIHDVDKRWSIVK